MVGGGLAQGTPAREPRLLQEPAELAAERHFWAESPAARLTRGRRGALGYGGCVERHTTFLGTKLHQVPSAAVAAVPAYPSLWIAASFVDKLSLKQLEVMANDRRAALEGHKTG